MPKQWGLTNGKPDLKEEIAKQETLLSIYKDIASSRYKNNILQRIHPKLKQLFDTDDIFICRYNSIDSTICPFLRVAAEKRKNDEEYRSVMEGRFPTGDRFFKRILSTIDPVSFSIDDVCSWPSAPPYAMISKKCGIRSCLSIALRHEGELLGIVTLWSEKTNGFTETHYELLKKVADQVSLILVSVIDQETIQQSKDDNSILLEISSELSVIREKEDLLLILKKQLQRLSFYDDVVIARVDSNGSTFSRFIVSESPIREEDPDYPHMLEAHHTFPDGVFEKALNSGKMVLFDLEEIIRKGKAPSYIQFIYKNGTTHMAGISLRDRNKTIAVLFLFSNKKMLFSDRQVRLVEGIASILGTTVANIIANNEIARQLEEISRYKKQLEEEKLYLLEEIGTGIGHSDIVGRSKEMLRVLRLIEQVSPAATTVLLLGETGTGKELVARAIHHSSQRKDKLMVKINCAAMPAQLVESELFGHEKGSFTGATERRIGKFELAHEGTLFLDEIGEISIELQAKLLRAIQEKEIERIGGRSPIKVDVRIIAATNRNLQKEVEAGRFRRDLFYRLNVFPIVLPSLRERKEDIPLLISHFIDRFSRSNGKKTRNISSRAMKQAMAYSWPGNIRELEHMIERSIITSTGNTIKELHLPQTRKLEVKNTDKYFLTHEENEREHIIRVLNECNGKVSGTGGAAGILNLKVSTLNSKIIKLGIRIKKEYK